jgi:hypothetical protein
LVPGLPGLPLVPAEPFPAIENVRMPYGTSNVPDELNTLVPAGVMRFIMIAVDEPGI